MPLVRVSLMRHERRRHAPERPAAVRSAAHALASRSRTLQPFASTFGVALVACVTAHPGTSSVEVPVDASGDGVLSPPSGDGVVAGTDDVPSEQAATSKPMATKRL